MLKVVNEYKMLQCILHPLVQEMVRCISKMPRKNEGIALQVHELIQRYSIMRRQFLHFFQADGRFTTDPSIGAVITDVQDISYGIYHGNMGGQKGFNVLKKQNLDISCFHTDQFWPGRPAVVSFKV